MTWHQVVSPFNAATLAAAAWFAVVPPVHAQAATVEPLVQERTVGDWLLRMHEASRKRAYVGTFVVSSASGGMSSSRIWHVCDGEQQMERVESLTGTPRSTFRRNDEVVTFLPESRIARTEKRESLGLFPNVIRPGDPSIGEFYSARQIGSDRVAGFDADVVQMAPKDNLRFGYRVWSEKRSGLVVKLQTLDGDSRVLEQAAFSELQLDAPVKMEKLSQMMSNTSGYRVEKSELVKTTALAEGWVLRQPVAGFKPMSCYKRPVSTVPADSTMQWIFSDGLASVSLFVEPYDRQRHAQETMVAMGATHALTRKIGDKADKTEWWLTVVGEVPPPTLKAFAQALERRK
ncbi:MucB/RseB C-terminal domain-containing protein [Variovorax sp. VNK109]|uniref:MucB/RseB C-terminal domain-containing protein n=1 Tax=Variovorax sp. VNK109 TaxID=3400919 RepID=UPI003C013E4A